VFTIDRIPRSRSTGLGVHDQTDPVFTIDRNTQRSNKDLREELVPAGSPVDLTSTYFESDPPDDDADKRRFGYSRDKRSDCVQVVIALIATPEGFPLAYEALPGNTADNSTLRDFLRCSSWLRIGTSGPPALIPAGARSASQSTRSNATYLWKSLRVWEVR
jgi:hypothetical protein